MIGNGWFNPYIQYKSIIESKYSFAIQLKNNRMQSLYLKSGFDSCLELIKRCNEEDKSHRNKLIQRL